MMLEPPADHRLPIRVGGLMRCCTDTWRTDAPPASQTPEGTHLICPHCDGVMVVEKGAWQWQPEPIPVLRMAERPSG